MINKKISCICIIIGILILCGSGTRASLVFNFKNTIELGQKSASSTSMNDELDQFQTNMTENLIIPIGNIQIPNNPISAQVAQSFIPTKEILTRLELFIGKNSTATYPLSISIREELAKEDLTVLDIDSSLVPTENLTWVEINFNDIAVTTGLTYYIVAITENVTDNFYGWGANNLSESYIYGCMWYSIDEGDTWTNKSVSSKPSSIEFFNNQHSQTLFKENTTWDMCFKTYGFDNLPPDVPVISGPTCGKPNIEYDFTFNSTDPNNNPVMFIVDWGDDNTEWTEYGDPGVEIILKHAWGEKGTFTIKAQAIDFYGAESNWGELTVTIPRDKSIQTSSYLNYIQNFLQNRPNLFQKLQKLLQ